MTICLNVKLRLAPWVLKRLEEQLHSYYFYNAKTKKMWSTEFSIGSVISVLDGTLTVKEVLNVLKFNNSTVSENELEETFLQIFEMLLKEEFLV